MKDTSLADSENAQSTNSFELEARSLSHILSALQPLDDASRHRVLRSASAFFEIPSGPAHHTSVGYGSEKQQGLASGFSDDRTLSAKEFLLQKRPTRDIDRI